VTSKFAHLCIIMASGGDEEFTVGDEVIEGDVDDNWGLQVRCP